MNFLKNYFSTILFIGILYAFYTSNSYFLNFLSWKYSLSFFPVNITSFDVFKVIFWSYIVLLIPFYLFEKDASKARITLDFLKNKICIPDYEIQDYEKTALLSWVLKWFFAPLMIFWLTWHVFSLLNNTAWFLNNLNSYWAFDLFFKNNLFPTFFSAILFLDVVFFTLWYLLEWKMFKNTIKSVEPTMLWWSVALMCYPPFNASVWKIIPWASHDMARFSNVYALVFFNTLLLILMFIYSQASVSLWLKASNLTNRWIVKTGPYKYMRHPAYFCKNIAWWIGWLPIIIHSAVTFDFKTGILSILSLSVWSSLYYLRAKTEEKHLSSDEDYVNYKKQVPNMFIPQFKKR
jgi:protein-S-isoprenylcysteine O-methyltransferase Ste14